MNHPSMESGHAVKLFDIEGIYSYKGATRGLFQGVTRVVHPLMDHQVVIKMLFCLKFLSLQDTALLHMKSKFLKLK